MTPDHQAPDPAIRPVDVLSVVDQVATELRRAIVRGALKPGSTFSLREIAKQFGVSFIPVREAIRSLEAQGLIITRPGRSAEIAPFDVDDVKAIYRLRKLVEPELAGRASTAIDTATAQQLDRLLVSYGDAEADTERRWDVHRQFHLELLRPAATPWDLRTLQMLWDAGDRYVRHAFDKGSAQPDEPTRRVEVHQALLAAVTLRRRRHSQRRSADAPGKERTGRRQRHQRRAGPRRPRRLTASRPARPAPAGPAGHSPPGLPGT